MRLENGFGSVSRLKGKRRRPYQVRKTIGYELNEKTGKSRQIVIVIGYASTRREGREMLYEYNKANHLSITNKATTISILRNLTFKDIYEKWSADKFPFISKSNVNGYKAAYKLCEKIYDRKFIELCLFDLQGIVDSCDKNYPTLRKLSVLFNQLYDYAIKNDICEKDYSKLVNISKYKDKNPNKQDRDKFTMEEVEKIWTLKDDRIYQTVLMLIYTGCRINELLNLKKENVHIKEQYFDVIASKTKNGIRKVPISDKILPFFKEWYNAYPDCEYILATNEGKHFTYRNYYDSYYKPIMKNIGIELTPHCCRHTCISMMATANIQPATIKSIVGHSGTMSMTEKVYTHFDIKTLIDAINHI